MSPRKKGSQHPVQPDAERFRHLVSSIGDYAIVMLDAKGYVTSWNAGAEKIKGYTADEILGSHFSRFYPADGIEGNLPKRALEVAAKEGRYEDEGWRIRKDGSRFWATVVLTALRGERGELIGFAKIARDLTARREEIGRAHV